MKYLFVKSFSINLIHLIDVKQIIYLGRWVNFCMYCILQLCRNFQDLLVKRSYVTFFFELIEQRISHRKRCIYNSQWKQLIGQMHLSSMYVMLLNSEKELSANSGYYVLKVLQVSLDQEINRSLFSKDSQEIVQTEYFVNTYICKL